VEKPVASEAEDPLTSEGVELPAATAQDLDAMSADSLTLPRIEQVLRSEGVHQLSITQQIDSLRKKVARYVRPTSHILD